MVSPSKGICVALLVLASSIVPNHSQAQRVVKKLSDICPMGYVDSFNGKCSTLGLMTYTVKPDYGKPCPNGWKAIGGGYCRLK